MRSVDRRRNAAGLAADHGGVASRRLLRKEGITAADIRAEVHAGRWVTHGRQTIAVHNRPLSDEEKRWRAIWEVGHDIAALDGVTALQAAGLRGYDEQMVHVSVVHTCTIHPVEGVRQHKVSRNQPRLVAEVGIPRVPLAVAAIRAAHWAWTDRQAALILLMAVQQRLVSPQHLRAAAKITRGRRRRAFVRDMVRDISMGVQAIGELDFSRLCRERGLPEPVRQEVREDSRGRVYLDVRFRCGLVCEIDGVQHDFALQPTTDRIRQNEVTLSSDKVLRYTNIGLRLDPDVFLDQVERGLRQMGEIGNDYGRPDAG
jgi:hypothetical protein